MARPIFRSQLDSPVSAASETQVVQELSITDEEKELRLHNLSIEPPLDEEGFSLSERPFLEAVFLALECSENDYSALFALCLLFAIGNNRGMKQSILESALFSTTRRKYNELLMERLLGIMQLACQPGTNSRVRLATLQLTLILLKQLVGAPRKSEGGESSEASPSEEQPIDGGRDTPTFILDRHLAAVEGIKEDATLLCRSFYKSEEIFLDMFEDEWRALHGKAFNVEFLMMESSLLLPPTGTPMTGIDFDKRLPCGEVERACRAIRIFFLLRELSLFLRGEEERELPLTSPENITRVGEVLDLNNSDLIACTILNRDQHRIRRFLVIDEQQIILVEPDTKRLGWGVAKFVGLLQDTEVTGDKEDSRCLHITVHKSSSSPGAARKPILSARFVFDDHIRCMAAKQRLGRGRMVARQRKVARIASLLELPASVTPTALSPRPRADARILSRAPGHPHHDPTSPSSAARFMTRPSSAASMPGGATSAAGFGPPQLKAPGFAAAMTSRHGNTISVVTSATGATRPSSCAIPSQLPPTPSVEAIPLGKIQVRNPVLRSGVDLWKRAVSATATPPECLPSQLPSREESRTTIQRDDASSTDESEENSQHRDRKGKIQVI
ncbi:unnamed protein product [Cyprideis torosa]|uniref:CLEC16A/TT9 C-terminal domain-containing protein n=1 Tax=Cyprideis torosa TaxID=163714 RepID=A0A7R8WD18_9CRUS|nr:unnamed protein product [Cyprideis torosa]CAG0894165.1 unnamed protein product [Cyprideis torosa]